MNSVGEVTKSWLPLLAEGIGKLKMSFARRMLSDIYHEDDYDYDFQCAHEDHDEDECGITRYTRDEVREVLKFFQDNPGEREKYQFNPVPGDTISIRKPVRYQVKTGRNEQV